MRSGAFSLLALGAALVCAPAVHSQDAFTYTGTWDLEFSVAVPNTSDSCSFFGTAEIRQGINSNRAETIEGPAMMDLVSGPAICPPELQADIIGFLDGTLIYAGTIEGPLGQVSFTGNVLQAKQTGWMKILTPVGGDFTITNSADPTFTDAMGSWGAIVPDEVFMDGFESVALTAGSGLLLLGGLSLVWRRRREQGS